MIKYNELRLKVHFSAIQLLLQWNNVTKNCNLTFRNTTGKTAYSKCVFAFEELMIVLRFFCIPVKYSFPMKFRKSLKLSKTLQNTSVLCDKLFWMNSSVISEVVVSNIGL